MKSMEYPWKVWNIREKYGIAMKSMEYPWKVWNIHENYEKTKVYGYYRFFNSGGTLLFDKEINTHDIMYSLNIEEPS